MRQFFRPIVTALSFACLAASFGNLSVHPALAQTGGPPQLKQIALTQKQIDDVIASQKEMDAITAKLPQDAPPNSKAIAQLDGVAKKHGFASYDDYSTVIGNISLVMDGIDPQSKKYIGSDAAFKQQIEQVKANKQMSAADKKQRLPISIWRSRPRSRRFRTRATSTSSSRTTTRSTPRSAGSRTEPIRSAADFTRTSDVLRPRRCTRRRGCFSS